MTLRQPNVIALDAAVQQEAIRRTVHVNHRAVLLGELPLSGRDFDLRQKDWKPRPSVRAKRQALVHRLAQEGMPVSIVYTDNQEDLLVFGDVSSEQQVRQLAMDLRRPGTEWVTIRARSQCARSRQSAALSWDATPELLRQLATDPSVSVRQAALYNPATPPDVLMAAWRGDDEILAATVLMNPGAPADLLRLVLQEYDCHPPYARGFAAGNPSCPPDVLARSLSDPDPYVRRAADQNPNLPAHLKALAQLI